MNNHNDTDAFTLGHRPTAPCAQMALIRHRAIAPFNPTRGTPLAP